LRSLAHSFSPPVLSSRTNEKRALLKDSLQSLAESFSPPVLSSRKNEERVLLKDSS